MNVRKLIGWGIATAFAVIGMRRMALRQYDKEGNVLSFFTHNPTPKVLEGVLAWLSTHGFTFISTDDLIQMRQGGGILGSLAVRG